MIRFLIPALGAAMLLGACTPPEITSRLDNSGALYSGFEGRDDYAPQPVGSRSENDLMRFSTTSMVR